MHEKLSFALTVNSFGICMKLKIYSIENSVFPYQRPPDQDGHCFPYNTQVILSKSNPGIELLENQTNYIACSKTNHFK